MVASRTDVCSVHHLRKKTRFCTLADSGFSMPRFKIQDDEIGKDDLAAWSCIRLDRLKLGYRFIRLFNAVGEPGQGVILVKMDMSFS